MKRCNVGTIEDILFVPRDMRIGVVREHLPENFCTVAASGILEYPGRAFILTGFYIPVPYKYPFPPGGTVETDGPPGAYAVGEALRSIGYEITYVTDRYCTFCFEGVSGAEDLIKFPIADSATSEQFAKNLLAEKKPSVVVVIERCGVNEKGRYLFDGHSSTRGDFATRAWDVTDRTAKLDFLMINHPHTVGIGDGGNEMGTGNLARWTREILPTGEPSITRSTWPVIASVSNWGAYGLVAALSLQTRRNLLPTVDAAKAFIQLIVDRGAVDGNGQSGYTVDGYTLEENAAILQKLWAVLEWEGVTST